MSITFIRKKLSYVLLATLPICLFKKQIYKLYLKHTNKRLNLDNPSRFTEKIQVLKMRYRNPLVTSLSNKLEVRNYVAQKFETNIYSPKLYGIWDSFEELEKNCQFKNLPERFVIKTNHASNTNVIIREKKLLTKNLGLLNDIFSKFLRTNYAYKSFEMQYENIKPKIYIEEFLEKTGEQRNRDYRFACFNGKPIYIEYFKDGTCSIYDINWQIQDFTHSFETRGDLIPKPKFFDKMIEMAEVLSKDFDFVRIDFLETDTNVYVLEMTFSPCSGYMQFYPDEYDYKWGNLLKLS